MDVPTYLNFQIRNTHVFHDIQDGVAAAHLAAAGPWCMGSCDACLDADAESEPPKHLANPENLCGTLGASGQGHGCTMGAEANHNRGRPGLDVQVTSDQPLFDHMAYDPAIEGA